MVDDGSDGSRVVRNVGLRQQVKDNTMKTLFNRFIKDESGATAIEYGLIAALIAVAIIGALNALSSDLSEIFGRVGTALDGAAATSSGGGTGG
jgi:pilus assembly protein Flp/PilA